MKKFTLMLLGLAVSGAAFAQTYVSPGKAIMSPKQYESVDYQHRVDQMNQTINEPMMRAQQLPVGPTYSPNGKTASVNSIPLGSASNAFTILRPEQNQVYANNDLGLVLFGHRNNAGIFGGSSGNLRYDFSIDGGVSWTNDVGAVNPALTRPARYPNFSAFNPNASSNPLDAKFVYSAPTLNPSPDWDGHVTGMWDMGAMTGGTEQYDLLSQQTYLQGGLCEGLPGEFWTVDVDYDGTAPAAQGFIFVNKGVYNGTDSIVWRRVDTIMAPHFTGFDGGATIVGPNISFSPDGMTGWIAWLGDLIGGVDTTLAPCFIKSSDGGATWDVANAAEFNYQSIPWVADTLKTLWTDSFNNPASSGEGTSGFDFDLIVDGQGNPHVAHVVGSRTVVGGTPGYSISSGIAKFMADVYSPDGGTTWDIAYLSPVLTFRTPDYGTSTTVSMDNNCQISRSPAGDVIFYSWVDSDTAQFTGSMNGVGFGEASNLAPNLRTTARHAYTGALAYPTLVTDGDLTWEGRALFPTMAPVALWDGTEYTLPIVICEFADPIGETFFHYFGDETTFDPARFCDPSGLTLSWEQIASDPQPACTAVGVDAADAQEVLIGSYPNPTAGEAIITFELPTSADITLTLSNMYGQEVSVLANGEYNAGAHKVVAQTQNLAAGVYFYSLNANGKAYTKKMIVTK